MLQWTASCRGLDAAVAEVMFAPSFYTQSVECLVGTCLYSHSDIPGAHMCGRRVDDQHDMPGQAARAHAKV